MVLDSPRRTCPVLCGFTGHERRPRVACATLCSEKARRLWFERFVIFSLLYINAQLLTLSTAVEKLRQHRMHSERIARCSVAATETKDGFSEK